MLFVNVKEPHKRKHTQSRGERENLGEARGGGSAAAERAANFHKECCAPRKHCTGFSRRGSPMIGSGGGGRAHSHNLRHYVVAWRAQRKTVPGPLALCLTVLYGVWLQRRRRQPPISLAQTSKPHKGKFLCTAAPERVARLLAGLPAGGRALCANKGV